MDTNNPFIEQYQNLDDQSLLEIIEKRDEYQENASRAAIKEILKRGIIEDKLLVEELKFELEKGFDKIWYYETDNGRKGPVNLLTIRSLIKAKKLNNLSLVWKDGFKDWEKIGNTELSEFVTQKVPPPLQSKRINSLNIWFIAFLPLFSPFISVLIKLPVILVVFILSVPLALLDKRRIKKFGFNSNKLNWTWIAIPVYIWKRAGLIKKGMHLILIWTFFFVLANVIYTPERQYKKSAEFFDQLMGVEDIVKISEEYKDDSKTIDYQTLVKESFHLNNSNIKLTGQILKILKNNKDYSFKISIVKNDTVPDAWINEFFVMAYWIQPLEDNREFADKDVVTIYGQIISSQNLAADGQERIVIPKINVKYIDN